MTKPSHLNIGAYDVVIGEQGLGAIRHTETGETMHASHDPREEAFGLYVAQPNIISRIQSNPTPLTIWDVGLGAATNAMECIAAIERASHTLAPIRIISFECDLDSLRLAIKHPDLFPHVNHPAPKNLLEKGSWTNPKLSISWELCQGDFLKSTFDAPVPDIIWYDPFSYKVAPIPWTVESFNTILKATRNHPCELYTYTASTAIRAGMLVAGWYVGYGQATNVKRETTICFSPTRINTPVNTRLLGALWLERWKRSTAKQPLSNEKRSFSEEVLAHTQFL
jgi:queuine tRNA-ribosyltransferase